MLVRLVSAVILVTILSSGCGESDDLKPRFATINHPSAVEQTDSRTVVGVLGRGEIVASLRLTSEYKSGAIPNHYQEQLRTAGWNICADAAPNQWIEFIDKSSGTEKTKSQLAIQFSKGNFDGEIRFEQERPKSDAIQATQGVGYLRITTPPSTSCAAKK